MLTPERLDQLVQVSAKKKGWQTCAQLHHALKKAGALFSVSTVWTWWKGRVSPRPENVDVLARVLEVAPERIRAASPIDPRRLDDGDPSLNEIIDQRIGLTLDAHLRSRIREILAEFGLHPRGEAG